MFVVEKMLIHRKVENDIADLLSNRSLIEWDRLPSERKIEALLDTSYTTVSRAVQKYTRSGILEKIDGKGTFVRKNPFAKTDTNIIGILHCHTGRGIVGSSFYSKNRNPQSERDSVRIILSTEIVEGASHKNHF